MTNFSMVVTSRDWEGYTIKDSEGALFNDVVLYLKLGNEDTDVS